MTNLNEMLKAELEAASQRRCQPAWKGLLYPDLSYAIVGAAIEVHEHIGPGQLEAVYQRALEIELERRSIRFRAQVPIPMIYKGEPVGQYYADVIVEDAIVLELKAVERLHPVHTAQILSYLKATKHRLGILINFNVPRVVQGMKRVVAGGNDSIAAV